MHTWIRVVLLSVLLAACFIVASIAIGLRFPIQAADPLFNTLSLLAMCFLDAAVLSCLIIRSRLNGWRLVAAAFIIFFSVKTFLSQVETLVFLNYLVEVVSAESVPKFFMQGLIIAAIFSPSAVFIHGRLKPTEADGGVKRLKMPLREWGWKLLSISILYVFIYLSFGMFVFKPLAGPAFQEYYSGLQLPWWILPFQAFRGILWAGLAALIIWMLRGGLLESSLVTAFLFSILMASSLLLPTEVMPSAIRMAHFIEIMSSNFLFGSISVWLLGLRNRISYRG